MAFIDYYKILGVKKDTPQDQLRTAYRKRAKQFHPDLHPNDPKAKAKFQALNEAYDVLSDPDKRAKYDRYGEQWQQADQFGGFGAGGFGGRGAQGNPFEGFDFSGFSGGSGGGFSSFFQDLFGGGSRRKSGGCGGHGGCGGSGGCGSTAQEQVHEVKLPLKTVLLGGDLTVQLSGTGSKVRLRIRPCTQNGTKVRLRGKGPAGTDVILRYMVELPAQLTDEQQQLIRQSF